MPQLRMELRRSSAPIAALASAVGYVLLLWKRQTWVNGWPDLSTSLRNQLIILIPLALAAGAWQGGRERRSKTEELMTTTPRPPWQRALPPTVAVGLGVLVAIVVPLIGVAIAHGPGNWLHQSWPLAVIVVGLLALAAAVALGAGLGRMIRTNLTAPLLLFGLALVLVYTYGFGEGGWGALLNPVFRTSEDHEGLMGDAQQIRGVVTAGQGVWLLGLLVGGLVLAGAIRWQTRLLAMVAILVGFVLAIPLLVSTSGVAVGSVDGRTAYGPDPAATKSYCAPGTPLICGEIVHKSAVLKAVGPARQVIAALQQLPDPPTRALETAQPDAPGSLAADVLAMNSFSLTSSRSTPAQLTIDLAFALGVVADCPDSIYADDTYPDAQYLAGAWLLNQPNTAVYTGDSEPALDRSLRKFDQLPRTEQVARMAAARQAFRACTPNVLATLTASGTKS